MSGPNWNLPLEKCSSTRETVVATTKDMRRSNRET